MLYKLSARRVERGIKSGEFARKLGITPQYLRLIEKGSVEPRVKLAFKIAKELNADPKELFFSEEN